MSQSLPSEVQTPPSGLPQPQPHPRFFDDGVIFLIENQFYRIPRNVLLQSEFFRDMFESFSAGESGSVEGNSKEKPIRPEGVTTLEIESLLLLLNTSVISGPPQLNVEQMGAILHLSTKWGFEEARSYVMSLIDNSQVSSLDRIELAFRCIVPRWLVPAYKELCTRAETLTLDEAQRLGIVRYHIISMIREESRPRKAGEIQPVWCGCYGADSVYCGSCGTYNTKPTWKCPIEIEPELQKHKDELGLAD